jgi:DNA primase
MIQGLIGSNGRAYLVFDSDAAGVKAARRSVPLFEKGFVDARILVLPPGHDPDSFVFEQGQSKLCQLAAEAKGPMAFLIDSAVSRHGKSMEGRIRVVDDMAAPLAAVTDPGARSIYVKYLAESVAIDETAVLEKIRQVAAKPTAITAPARRHGGAPPEPAALALSPRDRIERQLIAMMLQYPDILPEIRKQQIIPLMDDPTLRRIGQDVLDGKEGLDPKNKDDEGEYDRVRRLKAQLSIPQEAWDYRGCMRIIQHFVRIKRRQASRKKPRR